MVVLRSKIHTAIWPIIEAKHDVIHKTGNTQHIATTSEEDRATAISNMHRKCTENLAKIVHVVPKIS